MIDAMIKTSVAEASPVARIRRFFDAENEYCRAAPEDADISMMLQELDPDILVEVPASLPHGGTWRGHAGFVELFGLVPQTWAVFEVVSEEANWHVIDDGRVMTEGVLRGRLSSASHEVRMKVVSLFTFSDAGVAHLVHYYQDTAALRIGAGEPAAAGPDPVGWGA